MLFLNRNVIYFSSLSRIQILPYAYSLEMSKRKKCRLLRKRIRNRKLLKSWTYFWKMLFCMRWLCGWNTGFKITRYLVQLYCSAIWESIFYHTFSLTNTLRMKLVTKPLYMFADIIYQQLSAIAFKDRWFVYVPIKWKEYSKVIYKQFWTINTRRRHYWVVAWSPTTWILVQWHCVAN